ncbi:hypothetical protein IFM47457_10411 [Aspergillus lentulus]|nr:hypothetical protein IFM47457_10411 [Aspergillus lentulus]
MPPIQTGNWLHEKAPDKASECASTSKWSIPIDGERGCNPKGCMTVKASIDLSSILKNRIAAMMAKGDKVPSPGGRLMCGVW